MLTLGSLFDGIGGFPLSGAMHGIKPIWASEIEPFPILVTSKRFPEMRHAGSVTDIKGDQVEPVDILTFGSPCQDLSVAGAQKGIHEGARSSLFFEAVRIIKEMRNNDKSAGRTGKHVRPRFAVWENVPGAYSSNKGRDFLAVLQALCEVADPDVHVPFPQGGKWQKAGCIVGDGYSVAWRTLDAQYFPRTPQRRKRIYLVADFGSERAGEILFKPHSVRGNSEEGGEARQGTAEDAQGCAGKDREVCGGGKRMSGLINGRTAEEIKRGIKCHVSWGDCSTECPYDDVRNKPAHECIQSMTKDALALIERLEAQVPRWISVEERLPKPFVSVLVQMPGEKPHPTVREGYISNEGVWVAGHFRRDPDEVTNWMPLPEPPKEGAHEAE